MQNDTLFVLSLACEAAENANPELAAEIAKASGSILELSVLKLKAAREQNLLAVSNLEKQIGSVIKYATTLTEQAQSIKNGNNFEKAFCDGSGGMAGDALKEKGICLGLHGSVGQGGPEPGSVDQHCEPG